MASNFGIPIAELCEEAAEARELAAMLDEPASVADLLNYASALEADAAGWGSGP